MYGARGRIGLIVPANNSVIEPELWLHAPDGVTFHATRILARGDLTPEAIRRMEESVDRAVEELAATGVDIIVYADMVTSFLMEPGWNEERTAGIAARAGIPCISAWTAMESSLAALGVSRLALGTPYPSAIHALAPPFFAERGFGVVDDATLDIRAMREVPEVDGPRLAGLVGRLDMAGAEALVLLATDLPTFAALEPLERELGLPAVSSNQAILRTALRDAGVADVLGELGKLGRL